MAKLFGESISKDVVKQLEQRESILATGARDSQHLRYLNEKTAWVRAISGINVLKDGTKGYSNAKAKDFILSGGRYKWNSQDNKFEPRATNINFGQQENGRYSYTDDLGIRPEPGITSFSITHKNRYGTIREASLTFSVWTKQDLENAQTLFLRPGAQVIVEWGNSLYVTNEGDIEDSSSSERYNEYFKGVEVQQIYEIINNTRKETNYNYDGFLGLVTNFNWSFRIDGGYDCSISVVSRSSILESLSVLKPFEGGKKVEIAPENRRTLIDYFNFIASQKTIPEDSYLTLDDLKDYTRALSEEELENARQELKTSRTGTEVKSVSMEERLVPSNIEDLLKTNMRSYPYVKDDTVQQDFIINTAKVFGMNIQTDTVKKLPFRYISLRLLLALINKSFIFQSTSNVDFPSFYLGQPLKDVFLDSPAEPIEPQLYRTFDEHVSLDPFFAILPKLPSGPNLEELNTYVPGENYAYFKHSIELGYDKVNPFQIMHNNVTGNIIRNLPPGRNAENDILNIHINLGAVVKILDRYYESNNTPERLNVLDFVKDILSELNATLGSINTFDIDFNEDIQKYFIVDRVIVNEQLAEKAQEVQRINVTGLRNTVIDLKLESKITSELSSMIAISNQADSIKDVNSNQAFIDWNFGTRNRFINAEETGTDTETPVETQFPVGTSNVESRDGENIIVVKTMHIENDDGTISVVQKFVEVKASKRREDREEFYRLLAESYKDINNLEGGIFDRPTYREKYFQNLRGDGALYYKIRSTEYTETVDKKVDQGLIPLQLSLTMDGIGGFKIGQVFQIGTLKENSFILPEIYNNYGFIITGLNSTVDTSGKWFTEIVAQTFKISVPTKN
jgi:hypothetical protein